MTSEAGRHVKRKQIFVATSVAFCILSFFLLVANFLGNEDNHYTNLRYLTWKYGRAPRDYRWCLHLAFVDRGWRESMQGRSVEELRNWLPETRFPRPGTWQGDWLSNGPVERGVSYQVIGDSNIAVKFRNGKFDSLLPMKG